jgi:hypothetical protein
MIRVTTLPLTHSEALALLRAYAKHPDVLAEVYRQVNAYRVPDYIRSIALSHLQAAALTVYGYFIPPADQLTLARSLGLRTTADYLRWRTANMKTAVTLESALARA